MKLSSNTIEILKNYAEINPGIYFNKGNIIATTSEGKNILSEAEIEEYFPQEFGIYDLKRFLKILALYDNAVDLEFYNEYFLIKSGNGKNITKYRNAPKEMIILPTNSRPNKNYITSFLLTKDNLEWILKVANATEVPNIAIESDGNIFKLVSYDKENSSSTISSIELSDESNNKVFKCVLKRQFLKIVIGNYIVSISNKKFVELYNEEMKLKYWIACDEDSIVEGE